MHIKDMLLEAQADGKPSFSFEYFPPKTAQGLQNLYDRIDRMYNLGPKFIDITWGAGGSIADLTCDMVTQAQSVYGLDTCMHLTCTDMPIEKVDDALQRAYKAGCKNILALRGDLPRDRENWVQQEDGFKYAKDLVRYIRKTYGDHFDIGVAGYPEGCDDNKDEDELLDHLKQKIDEGATFIVTQMFYDGDNFVRWVKKIRERGIDTPILPGIMPIATYASFMRRANHMGCKIPQEWLAALESVKNDDVAVRKVGTKLVAALCQKLIDNGIFHLHFYTMNLMQATHLVLEELGWAPTSERPFQQSLPWKPSKGLGRRDEDVRPIFWRNRNKSYVLRTQDWDEFPNGRWGDSRSPAFGTLDAYGNGLSGSNEANKKKWGEPKSYQDVADLFVSYLKGDITSLPWCESALSGEVATIHDDLIDLNKRGLLTVNSQPAVNGAKSNDPVHGWGPENGYVFQKAYLELFIAPELIPELLRRVEEHPELTYYAIGRKGEMQSNTPSDGPNAVTWGVFPGKEIVQPTIVEAVSFLAWRDEAYSLGMDWSKCYDSTSTTRAMLETMMKDWYLVNIVDNDFHQTRTIFDILRDLEVADRTKPFVPQSGANGHTNGHTNGHANGLA